MKIGDKVRFLSETGGGVVSGFQGKNIVLVEDEDGFQIPTAITDVVVVSEENYQVSSMVKDLNSKSDEPVERKETSYSQEEEKEDYPEIEERQGGDLLSVYLAFVPVDIKELSKTRFEAYIVNDCNYYINYAYYSAVGAAHRLRSEGVVEPNTKLFIEEFSRDDLELLQRVSVQLFSYKLRKDFILKAPIDVRFRIDVTKFYKLHTFKENEFFEQLALIYPIVENDKPQRGFKVDAEKLKQEMMSKVIEDLPKPRQEIKKEDPNAPIVIDLHASELLDSTKGLKSSDILNYQLDVFRSTMEKYKKLQGKKIIFIHGKGEGVLRHAIIHELTYRYKKCTYQDASFREYGFGATQVNIK
ncbi:MAG: DUF2027 domain-containing protein [Prevotella sp.]|nr:DUF2027 domain-containing protein [Prevotella sp.]